MNVLSKGPPSLIRNSLGIKHLPNIIDGIMRKIIHVNIIKSMKQKAIFFFIQEALNLEDKNKKEFISIDDNMLCFSCMCTVIEYTLSDHKKIL